MRSNPAWLLLTTTPKPCSNREIGLGAAIQHKMNQPISQHHNLTYSLSLLILFFLSTCAFSQQPTGHAWYSNGLTGVMAIADTAALEFNGDTLAIEAWVHQCETDSAQVILGKQWCTLNTEYYFSLADGHIRWGWSKNGHCSSFGAGGTDGYWVQTVNELVQPGGWNHVAVMHTRTGITFWHNGVQVPDTDVTYHYFNDSTVRPKPTDPNEYTIFKGNHDAQIGAYKKWNGVQGAQIKGYLDQLAVWTTLPPNLATRPTTELDRTASGLITYFDMESYTDAGLATHRFFDTDGQAPVLQARRLNGGPYDIGTVYDFPDGVYLGNDTSMYLGTSLDLVANIDAPGNITYLWDDGSTNPVRTIVSAGTYYVDINWSSCIWTDTIVVSDLGPLPIELTWFQAVLKEGQVNLQWNTASDSYHREFTVQRSGDGTRFQDLTTLSGEAAEPGVRQFNTADPQPLHGTAYYRLRMIENDGSIEYSPIRTVVWNPNEKVSMDLYPNPAEDRFVVEIFNEVTTPIRVQLINLEGKVIKSWQSEKDDQNRIELSIEDMAAGLYVARILADGHTTSRRLLIK